ncbi:hypothetical protein PspTeo4_21088 [Pseudomonas sp. Teo4]|nr:hypothetical protein [Pseudomonas sp. Teo4]
MTMAHCFWWGQQLVNDRCAQAASLICLCHTCLRAGGKRQPNQFPTRLKLNHRVPDQAWAIYVAPLVTCNHALCPEVQTAMCDSKRRRTTMSTTLLSAVTVALLSAACLTALADSKDAADSTSGFIQAVERNGSHSMHPYAPVPTRQFADDDASGYIQAVGRNGSHSMHPNAPVIAEQFADDDTEGLQQTGTQ